MRAVTGRARPLLVDRVDTDVIAPQSELVVVDRAGLGNAAFKCWRDPDSPRPAAAEPLVDPDYADAPILLAGAEFGCGSSREHAVWALLGFGVRAVVAPSFGEIFLRNALRNHLVVVSVAPDDLGRLAAVVQRRPDAELTVDLEAGAVTAPLPAGEVRAPFTLDDTAHRFLVDEADEITDTLALLAAHGRGEVTGA